MSSTGTRSDLPATGSTYQPTKSEAISFSNNTPFGSSEGGHHHHQHHQHQVNGPDPNAATATATATTATTAYDSVTQQPTTAMGGTGTGQSSAIDIPDRANPTTNAINYADEANPLQAHHRPSLAAAAAAAAGDNEHHGAPVGLGGDETIRRHSVAQNAPGKLGERGENILGAIGFGGAAVERPKEDQGIGEKIAEFLGA
ncbi:hypothetical protein CLCR_07624 [Cladophialophora carrionii]|uniref:Uncharacterized protein n=1 Tax=Cladophialophora carrionii TaxID=86049 RepID=A0A1C1CN26_9EURO|nr:hypothetical protein CLCR_07624 [Cladophialophora carrionii]